MKETGKCSICGKHAVIWRRTINHDDGNNAAEVTIQYCKRCALYDTSITRSRKG